MFEIPEVCEFEIGADQVRLSTQTNGDSVEIKRLNFDKNQAAALAYLINKSTNHLTIEIKEVS
jgi:hypothetical protein